MLTGIAWRSCCIEIGCNTESTGRISYTHLRETCLSLSIFVNQFFGGIAACGYYLLNFSRISQVWELTGINLFICPWGEVLLLLLHGSHLYEFLYSTPTPNIMKIRHVQSPLPGHGRTGSVLSVCVFCLIGQQLDDWKPLQFGRRLRWRVMLTLLIFQSFFFCQYLMTFIFRMLTTFIRNIFSYVNI